MLDSDIYANFSHSPENVEMQLSLIQGSFNLPVSWH
jgi:hypothetical protein